MQYRVFDDMSQCNEQEIARLLSLVSDQRRQQALAYKHPFGQFCCLKSYELLLQLLASYPHRPIASSPNRPFFRYNAYGAPYLPDGPYFSISHCKHAIAVAVSEMPVGIDVEHIRVAKPELVARTMNEHEQQQITSAAQADMVFTCLWTQKEAVLKMHGTGITSIDGIKNTLVEINNIDLQTKVNIDKQYVLTIAQSR